MNHISLGSLAFLALAALPCAVRSQTKAAEPPELVSVRAHYDEEISKATKPVKVRYAEYLETLKKTLEAKHDTNGALAVQQEIASLRLLPVDAMHPTKVVVWNQHNGEFNDRGTQSFNLSIISDGKEVWRLNDIKIPWEAGEDSSVTINVPSVQADKLRIEIVGTVKGSGGLAEVEYWKDGKNLAKKRRVTVSSVWENDEHFVGDKLTDGITTSKEHETGYWLAPDNEAGWAEIQLR